MPTYPWCNKHTYSSFLISSVFFWGQQILKLKPEHFSEYTACWMTEDCEFNSRQGQTLFCLLQHRNWL